MEPKVIFEITTKVIAGTTAALLLFGFAKGVIKYVRIRFVNKQLRFTHRGEEELK